MRSLLAMSLRLHRRQTMLEAPNCGNATQQIWCALSLASTLAGMDASTGLYSQGQGLTLYRRLTRDLDR